jgi:hypothetical protein
MNGFFFKDGVGCSLSCKCQGCKNIHGRKDSTAETKSELEETKALQISRFDKLIFVFDEMIKLMLIIDFYSLVCDRTLPPLPYSLMGKPPHISCSELFGSKNHEPVESNTNPECENGVESSPTRNGGMNSIRMRTILLQ